MSSNYIESDDDLFGMELPTIEPDGQLVASETMEVTVQDKIIDFIQGNKAVSYSIIAVVLIILLVILVKIIKSVIAKSKNPMAEYTKQQTKKAKQQAYVSSSNKLETPDNIVECIRAFLERTK